VPPEIPQVLEPDADGLVYFDDLSQYQVRFLPSYAYPTFYSLRDSQIMVMKKHLEQKVKVGKRKPKLKDIDPEILPAAWSILRWCKITDTLYKEE